MIAYRLALELGYPHPDYLLEELTPDQWFGWLAYFGIDGPVGPQRGDLQAGIIAAAVKSFLTGKQFDPWQFMPWHVKPQQTPEEMQLILRSVIGNVRSRSPKRSV